MTEPVFLSPSPGFCIKSTVLQPAAFRPQATRPTGDNVLEPQNTPVPVPVGRKVFINIAWDHNVPAPPPGSDDAIQRAMKGEDIDDRNPDGWYVPVVVSDGRLDRDKAGNPALVFDCVYNSSVKARSLIDPEFKIFLIELALQRLEAQTSLVLSRQIGTPNIASKGKLLPRTVSIPSFLLNRSTPAPVINAQSSSVQPSKPLIEEVHVKKSGTSSAHTKPKGILKPSRPNPTPNEPSNGPRSPLAWSWSKKEGRIEIAVSVPSISRAIIGQTSLDVEPRRFMLNVPGWPLLDINLDLSDAEIVSRAPPSTSVSLYESQDTNAANPNNTLTLKRQRDFDVEKATAEWMIPQHELIITV